MAKPVQKEIARKLRTKGFSIGEISNKLSQPKSTVSYWCKNISLSATQIHKIQKRHKKLSVARLLLASEKQRADRVKREQEDAEIGRNRVGFITKRDLYILGLGLYWGEGYKYEHSEFGFTNSDPKMIRTYVKWLNKSFGIKKESLIFRISINEIHAHNIESIKAFWEKETGAQSRQFTKTSIIPSQVRKVFPDTKKYYGTLRVKVRNGKRIKNQVLSAIENFSKQI